MDEPMCVLTWPIPETGKAVITEHRAIVRVWVLHALLAARCASRRSRLG